MSNIVNTQLARLDINKMSKSQIESALDKYSKSIVRLVSGVKRRNWNLLILGEPGTGKTQIILDTLKDCKNAVYIKGVPSAAGLFKFAYEHRTSTIILDDCDHIYDSVEGTEILKAMCDTQKTRKVSWVKQNTNFQKLGIPQHFIFTGNVILISNKDLRIQHNRITKSQRLMKPVVDRMPMLLAGMPNRKWDLEYIKLLGNRNQVKIFQEKKINKKAQSDMIKFLEKNLNNLNSVSFRTLSKMVDFYINEPSDWKELTLETV